MFTTRPEILGTFGVVTSTHWLATASGMAMLEKGGNAFDACAAAAFVLQVVEPHLVGPGRRHAGGVLFGRDQEGRSALRPGAGAGCRDDQGL
jgi:gamma-glutamyltranspeptidase